MSSTNTPLQDGDGDNDNGDDSVSLKKLKGNKPTGAQYTLT